MNFIHDKKGEDDKVEEMDGLCEDVVILSEGCVISINETTMIYKQMHVQKEIIMDSGRIELTQGKYSAMTNNEASYWIYL